MPTDENREARFMRLYKALPFKSIGYIHCVPGLYPSSFHFYQSRFRLCSSPTIRCELSWVTRYWQHPTAAPLVCYFHLEGTRAVYGRFENLIATTHRTIFDRRWNLCTSWSMAEAERATITGFVKLRRRLGKQHITNCLNRIVLRYTSDTSEHSLPAKNWHFRHQSQALKHTVKTASQKTYKACPSPIVAAFQENMWLQYLDLQVGPGKLWLPARAGKFASQGQWALRSWLFHKYDGLYYVWRLNDRKAFDDWEIRAIDFIHCIFINTWPSLSYQICIHVSRRNDGSDMWVIVLIQYSLRCHGIVQRKKECFSRGE